MTGQPLDVWYRTDQTKCNFACSYCITEPVRQSVAHRMWATDDGLERFGQILFALSRLEFDLRMRVQTHGEPFVCKDFLDGVAWMSAQDNLQFVEMVTNASFRPKQLRTFLAKCDVSKLSMWATFHHGQIDVERFVDACALAQELGVSVVAHGLLFPDSLEELSALQAAL